MKKNLLNLFLIGLLIVLSGCGSNSKRDPIKVNKISDSNQTEIYYLSNETTILDVYKNNEIKIISVDVVNNRGVGVPGQEVSISAVSGQEFGSITGPSTVKTNEGGHAVFTYTSPNSIDNINGKSTELIMTLNQNNNMVSKSVLIKFIKLIGDESDVFLVNQTSNVEITRNEQIQNLSVDVVNKSGIGVSDYNVSIKSISGVEFGTITSPSTIKTDKSGHAFFEYKAPNDILAINGKSIKTQVFTISNGKTISKDIMIHFNQIDNGIHSETYFLKNETKNLKVTKENEIKILSVDVVNESGIGVGGQEVSISAVDGVKYGAIVSPSTIKTNEAGHAIFEYKAPSDIQNIDGETISVNVSINNNGKRVSREISIIFSKINVDGNTVKPVVSIISETQVLNSNSQNIELEIRVFDKQTNRPYSEGNVTVSLPKEAFENVDIGTFTSYSVPVENGRAIFNYTGPQDLKKVNGKSSIFKFYHEDNPESVASITIIYKLEDGYVPANYILTTFSSDGKQTMGLELLKTFTIDLKDDKGNLIADSKINKLTIVSKNITVGKLKNGTSNVDSLIMNDGDAVNSKSFSIQTFKLSGLLPVEIKVDFTDANGKAASKTIIMNIVVFSGPPTSISISYAGVEKDEAHANYVEKFSIAVTDAYNNPVNTRPYVAVGSMVEYAVDGSSATGDRTTTSPRLWHGTNDSKGMLESIGGNKAQFIGSSSIFQYVDYANDKMVLFGSGFVFEALGKWDIFDNTDSVMGLVDSYTGTNRSNILYAVGHNHRQDLCANDARKYLGTMKATSYQLDENGRALVEFQYDYHLTGKDIMVWANLTGLQADTDKVGRLGVSQKHTLRGKGFYAAPVSYGIPKNSSVASYAFKIHHENAPEWYRNGHFGYSVKGTCKIEGLVDSSNYHDARECTNTIGYVILNISNPSDKDCTVSLSNIAVASEFSGVNNF